VSKRSLNPSCPIALGEVLWPSDETMAAARLEQSACTIPSPRAEIRQRGFQMDMEISEPSRQKTTSSVNSV
jgi:hypothetical protein